jgi:hypothetical protein
LAAQLFNARRIGKAALAIVVVLVAWPYAWGPVYDFPPAVPFSGTALYNPYGNRPPRWQRANFHAHGRAWVGLTNGVQSDDEVARRYRELGYDVPGVSDYQRIAANHGVATIPVYEHGYNIIKQHQLAIGAHDVEWLDFLLWQSLSHQQYVIDRVRKKSDLIALAHPSTRDAYTAEDLQQLTGYDLIEIVNGPFAALDVWDSALSAGRAVWALADDDTHDLQDVRRTAAAWNMVGSATAGTSDIVDALRAGRTYAVLRTGAIEAAHVTTLNRLELDGHQMHVHVDGAAANITFIGQNGVARKTVRGRNSADYTFTDHDTYVRTVIESPQTVLYLNPVIRYDGVAMPKPAASVDAAATWTMRGGIGLALGLLVAAKRRGASGAAGSLRIPAPLTGPGI